MRARLRHFFRRMKIAINATITNRPATQRIPLTTTFWT